jgi:type III pantothenate kinase
MSILLIDIGNTRVKWAFLARADEALGQVYDEASGCGVEQMQLLFSRWSSQSLVFNNTRISAIFLVTVSGQRWRSAIEAWALELNACCICLQSESTTGRVRNLYNEPNTLGADRWAMAIAAADLFPDKNCVVISAGTATTVDAISSSGEFLGGLIMPGFGLMLSSLHQNTARLPHANWQIEAIPRNTDAAISTGVLDAQLGAINRFSQRLAEQSLSEPNLILTGGYAPTLAEFLPTAKAVPNLVLKGVGYYAQNYFKQNRS